MLDDLVQDVRYTFRELRKAPLFTLTAIVPLAVGIGATAAVFTVVERVLLRPLPVSKPHELVYVTDERILTQPSPRFSYPLYRPVLQTRSTDAMTLHVRASSDPGALVNAIRLAIQTIDPKVPLFGITTLEAQLDASFAQTRQAALLSGTFGD